MADLDFTDYQGPVKNPSARKDVSLTPRVVKQINVSREAVVTVEEVQLLLDNTTSNQRISQDQADQLVNEQRDKKAYLGFPGLRFAESTDEGHLSEVLAVAMRILHPKA